MHLVKTLASRSTARRSFSASTAHVHQVVCVGLGNMGYPLAGRIAGAGFPTSVYNIGSDAIARHNAEHGSTPCVEGSLEDAVANADILVTCLPNSNTVRSIRESLRGKHKQDSVWLDATSGDPNETAILAAELLASDGVHFVDCAVSGGPTGCREGALTSMVGGDESAFAVAKPVIESFSNNINHLGPAGSGHAVKAVNNTLLAINIWASGEALLALRKFGCDPKAAISAINTSSGRNWGTMQRYPDNILTGKYDYGFSLGLHAKDVRTAIRMLGETPAPAMRLADQMLQISKAELGPDADHTEVVKVLEKWMEVELLK